MRRSYEHPLDYQRDKAEEYESSRMAYREEVLNDVLPGIVTFIEKLQEDKDIYFIEATDKIIEYIEDQN